MYRLDDDGATITRQTAAAPQPPALPSAIYLLPHFPNRQTAWLTSWACPRRRLRAGEVLGAYSEARS